MGRLNEIVRGLQQFSKTGDPQNGSINPVGEFIWLARRSVQEDKIVQGLQQRPTLADAKIYFQRIREMGYIFAEVFAFQEYDWQPKSDTPRIIDLGGDIGGYSVLHWKSLAPQARVTLVEANPATATVVAENFKRKGLQDVEVINAAVSDQEGEVELHLSGYNPSNFIGARSDLDPSSYRTIIVPTIKLSDIIGNERVDLLKMDIEGAEGGAIRDLASTGKLELIDEIMMEFHNDPGNPSNSIAEVVQTLENANFRIENPHISGRTRKRRAQTVDLNAVQPSDTILFALTAKRIVR